MFKKLLLASSSPRRKELLTLAGVSFEIRVPDVDETPRANESPVNMVKRLALEKAKAVWVNEMGGKGSGLILAADTTVVNSKDQILGKPRNKKEAMAMIASLQGKIHRVYTGYAIIEVVNGELQAQKSKSVQTKVYIRELSGAEIKVYVNRGESMDKAGAYAAQGFGMTIIQKIEGSYTNVVGLPMAEVLDDLKQLGWRA